MTPAFWKGRRVLLTGHTGFKGGWLALWLQELGAEVTGYSLPPDTQPNLFEAAGVAHGMHSRFGDVRDLASLQAAFQDARPEVVLHLAAQALVRRSYREPVETYATNVMGTVHLLEAVRQTGGVAAVVVVTTDKCYENREWVWAYRENEPMGGHDPYSSSKGCAELVTSAYRRSYFTDDARGGSAPPAVASARAGNVIGGGDWSEDRLVPDLLRAFQAGEQVDIRHPQATRPWQHVLEPLGGYLLLAEHLADGGHAFAEGWNFGPREEDSRSVGWIADRMVQLWGSHAGWHTSTRQHPHEAHHLKLDISKARQGLHWQPRLNLDQALALTVDWARGHAEGVPARALCQSQIRDYARNLPASGMPSPDWPARERPAQAS